MTEAEVAQAIRKLSFELPRTHPAQKALHDAHNALSGPKVIAFRRPENPPPSAA